MLKLKNSFYGRIHGSFSLGDECEQDICQLDARAVNFWLRNIDGEPVWAIAACDYLIGILWFSAGADAKMTENRRGQNRYS